MKNKKLNKVGFNMKKLRLLITFNEQYNNYFLLIIRSKMF